MDDLVRSGGLVRPCCLPENMIPHQAHPDLVVKKCRTCGARHFEMTVDPGRAFSTGARL